MYKIPERLKELRKTRGCKQQDVATFLDIHVVSYARFEQGKVRPSLDTLIALADFFDVSLDYLVGRSDKKR